jgi:hypothetical protein
MLQYLKEISRDSVNWVHVAQDRGQLLSFCEHGNEYFRSIKCWEFDKQLLASSFEESVTL